MRHADREDLVVPGLLVTGLVKLGSLIAASKTATIIAISTGGLFASAKIQSWQRAKALRKQQALAAIRDPIVKQTGGEPIALHAYGLVRTSGIRFLLGFVVQQARGGSSRFRGELARELATTRAINRRPLSF